MARNKEYDREEVLDAATRVFWAQGFKGTPVSDLVKVTGLGKRSMYQEFGSKEGLFSECIDHYVYKLSKKQGEILTEEPLGLRNIDNFFRDRIDYLASKECCGCLTINTAIEKEVLEEKVFEQVKRHLSSPEDAFCKCLKAAQKRGEIAQEKDCRALASFLFTFTAGLLVMGKTGLSRKSLATRVDIALAGIKN